MQVRQGLGGVVVAAVTGVDDRHQECMRCHQRRALLGVAHGDDIGSRQLTTRMVSATLSPLEAEELAAEEKPSTCPPSDSMALSKLRRVRVEGSKNSVARILPSHLWAYAAGWSIMSQPVLYQFVDLLGGELHNVDQIFHISFSLH